MPRWPTTASPESRANHRYLPRRWTAVTVRSRTAATKSSPPATCRRTARGWNTSTALNVRPETHCDSPWRTVSTSGSSGMSVHNGAVIARIIHGIHSIHSGLVGLGSLRRGQRVERRLGRALLRLLLRPALHTAMADTADHRPGGERLGVVRTGLLDLIVRHTEPTGRGQLLQAGLPVESGPESRRLVHHGVE